MLNTEFTFHYSSLLLKQHGHKTVIPPTSSAFISSWQTPESWIPAGSEHCTVLSYTWDNTLRQCKPMTECQTSMDIRFWGFFKKLRKKITFEKSLILKSCTVKILHPKEWVLPKLARLFLGFSSTKAVNNQCLYNAVFCSDPCGWSKSLKKGWLVRTFINQYSNS